MGVVDGFVNWANSVNLTISSILSPEVFLGATMFFFAVLIAIGAYIIWKFYRTLSKRNFIHLNLKRYNMSKHPFYHKLFALGFYFVEYLLIMPILTLLWFVLLSSILVVIASDQVAINILLLSGSMIMAIRILAYYNEEISKDLAKLFPFIALSLFLLTPGAFEISGFLGKLRELPGLFENILFFLFFIILLEIFMRVIYTVSELFKGKEEVGEEIEEEKKKAGESI